MYIYYLFAIDDYLSLADKKLGNLAGIKVNECKSFFLSSHFVSWEVNINNLKY